MATYNDIDRSKHATLVGSTVDTINFIGTAKAVEIVNLGTDHIYARWDAENPAVGGDETVICRAKEAITREVKAGAVLFQVRLISAGAAEYHVERIP